MMSSTKSAYAARTTPSTAPEAKATKDRRLNENPSAWVRSFSCQSMRPLIVCRGPIRKEALDIFTEMGIDAPGILLSEKDSIVYPRALSPELRQLRPEQIHRVPDYSGASKKEREERIAEIISIARTHGYDSVFAGYGFMAEDEALVSALEEAGLNFMGPCAKTVRAAGRKDEAKRTALLEDVSVTPGVNDATARLLLKKYPDEKSLQALVSERALSLAPISETAESETAESVGERAKLLALADRVLEASYVLGIDLYSIEELCVQIRCDVAEMFAQNPGSRIRLKAISGGGGKGQRILGGIEALASGDETQAQLAARAAAQAEPAGELVREILAEVKTSGEGDNKNVLVELNIEQTRHQEIQLIGNGTWSLAMGGRDCSLQMHEQKLLEVSTTQEGLATALDIAKQDGEVARGQALERDLSILQRMEGEAERFGRAVGLDSASTFECIVDGGRHFFMEVNTRIQVEHRVSELCYDLRFTNPDDEADFFEVDSLVETMVLLAAHGPRLPRPTRQVAKNAAVEARLNATDPALSPHAGGMIISWSEPLADEIRDDQGICLKNPDTGSFMHYRIAGAYDSNVALLVTHGDDRRDSYKRLAEILRRTRLRGSDLCTNLEFHRGLVHWFLGQDVMAQTTTRFIVPYLTQVGLIRREAEGLDYRSVFAAIAAAYQLSAKSAGADVVALKAWRASLDAKYTLLERPFTALLAQPHLLSAWLSDNRESYEIVEGAGSQVVWKRNPLQVLAETYHLLDMWGDESEPAAYRIWTHDRELLQRGRTFYERLGERLNQSEFAHLSATLGDAEAPEGIESALWRKIRESHLGFQSGMEVLGSLALIGHRSGFTDLCVNDDLSIHIPERLNDPALQVQMRRTLAPPPATVADHIVAASGGMFYPQEAPGRPSFVAVGDHFDAGDPLCVIEVMKMFNKVRAPFAGTIDKLLIEGDGTIVKKGQPLFSVTPDEPLQVEDPAVVEAARKAKVEALVEALC